MTPLPIKYMFACVAILTSSALGATRYVPQDYPTIQEAVEASTSGDEIVVAPGTYTSTHDGHVVDLMGKDITIRSSDGPETTIIDGENIRRGIACYQGESQSALIQGFTITNGLSVNYDYSGNGGFDLWEDNGGGLICISSSPSIHDCIFSTNTNDKGYGGGIYSRDGSPHVLNCSFQSNRGKSGGGIGSDHSSMYIENCTFTSNIAFPYSGGGISDYGGSLQITNCVFVENYANDEGGAIKGYFGGDVVISGCELLDNYAGEEGGGIWFRVTGTKEASLLIENTNITENSSGLGGGVFYMSGDLQINSSNISFNTSLSGGGGINVQGDYGQPSLSNTVVCGNNPVQISGKWDDIEGNLVTDICPNDCNNNGIDDADEINDGLEDDCNQNWILDSCELASGEATDCNLNGALDSCDIANGNSSDYDQNQVADDCECLADISSDGEVNVDDVLVIIAFWSNTGGLADVNYDGTVNVDDLLYAINSWGVCP